MQIEINLVPPITVHYKPDDNIEFLLSLRYRTSDSPRTQFDVVSNYTLPDIGMKIPYALLVRCSVTNELWNDRNSRYSQYSDGREI